ncbi:hypothetical protein EXN67_29010 [Rhizobium rhizogenes]|nr:hypothetical protein [Rhizobium rhizogenes]NTG91093.1 hypothetical protein [Rhizobium rhizogenes]TRB03449.1 hypothetical protein EXN67_29010 [Rhizobium rhizogenes]TRB38191.1 hypothetical protein EXN73_28575 [Rhizobium rhizogenes]TRB53202.1 hypothetical protein EXN71_28560 [Rhizobium rhizogenes]
MKARLIGMAAGGILGALIGSGTGIVGGIFGAIAGLGVFAAIGIAWGFSLGPDISRVIRMWLKSRR